MNLFLLWVLVLYGVGWCPFAGSLGLPKEMLVKPFSGHRQMGFVFRVGLFSCYGFLMIRAVLFDVYGTIAGWTPSRYELQKRACAAFGLEGSVTPEGILRGYAGADAFMTAENASRPLRLRDREGKDEFFSRYQRIVLRGCGIEVEPDLALQIFNRLAEMPSALTPFADVVPTFGTLRDHGLTLGLISNMDIRGTDLLADLGLSGHVEFAVTSREIGVEKPHPLAFQTALIRAGVGAGEAVMVGDQPKSDVLGAARLGIGPILIDRDGNYPHYEDCPRITTLEQLPPLIEHYDLPGHT